MPIRVRLAVVCAAATVVVLVGAGLIFISQLRSGLDSSLDATLHSRADTLVSELAGGETVDPPDPTTGIAVLRATDTLEQVLTPTGALVQSSTALGGRPLLGPGQLAAAARSPLTVDVEARLTIGTGGPRTRTQQEDHGLRVLAFPLGRAGQVAVVAVSRDVVEAALARTGTQLLALGAVVLLIAVGGAYALARAALRPVERMRLQADDLGAHDVGATLAVPATRDEVAALARTMNALLDRLHRALAHERAFVADAGHELRTPLTVLRGELELAQRPGRSREELSATVTVAAEETDRLVRLAEDLLLLAGAQEGSPPRRALVDLPSVAVAALQACRARAAARDIVMALDAPTGAQVLADADRVRQALDNLLANALRVSPCGGTVTIVVAPAPRLAGEETMTAITVLDEGPGFPLDFLPVAFERFRRADGARSRTGGTDAGSGLGLAIVRSIADSHGGTASACNRAAGGAAVSVTFPTGPTAGTAPAPPQPAPASSARAG